MPMLRHECIRPSDMQPVNIKKLAQFNRVGKRIEVDNFYYSLGT
jgi:hypothetical protein